MREWNMSGELPKIEGELYPKVRTLTSRLPVSDRHCGATQSDQSPSRQPGKANCSGMMVVIIK